MHNSDAYKKDEKLTETTIGILNKVQQNYNFEEFYDKDINLLDPFVSKLVERGGKLGFNIELIKRTLFLFPSGKPQNENDFYEKLISLACELFSNNDDTSQNEPTEDNYAFQLWKRKNSAVKSFQSINKQEKEYDSNANNLKQEFDLLYVKPECLVSTQPHDVNITSLNIFGNINNELVQHNIKLNNDYNKQNSPPGGLIKQSNKHHNNVANGRNQTAKPDNLRPIVIDGDNLGFCLDTQKFFCERIKLAVEYFQKRGHEVYVIMPSWRKNSAKGNNILNELKEKGVLHYTPAKCLPKKQIQPDDDLVILNFALEKQAIVVSNDDFVKFIKDAKYRNIVEGRILMYTIIGDSFLPCEDSLGKHGSILDSILNFESEVKPCPYKSKCTYGSKCKYYHPERGSQQHTFKTAFQAVLDEAQEAKSQIELNKRNLIKKDVKSSTLPLNHQPYKKIEDKKCSVSTANSSISDTFQNNNSSVYMQSQKKNNLNVFTEKDNLKSRTIQKPIFQDDEWVYTQNFEKSFAFPNATFEVQKFNDSERKTQNIIDSQYNFQFGLQSLLSNDDRPSTTKTFDLSNYKDTQINNFTFTSTINEMINPIQIDTDEESLQKSFCNYDSFFHS